MLRRCKAVVATLSGNVTHMLLKVISGIYLEKWARETWSPVSGVHRNSGVSSEQIVCLTGVRWKVPPDRGHAKAAEPPAYSMVFLAGFSQVYSQYREQNQSINI